MTRTLLLTFLVAVGGCASGRPGVTLSEWERGVAVESADEPGMKVYLWFYEWNMFDAVQSGQHTHGGYGGYDRSFDENGTHAVLSSESMRLEAKAVEDGAELCLTITNRSDHDWPPLAGIIPCFNPGPRERRNPQFANEQTYFVSAQGLTQLERREIHFNDALRTQVDRESDHGVFPFTYKWPTSDVNAMRGLLLRESTDGEWVAGIAWERFLSSQGHNPWECMHLCVLVGPLARGEQRTIRGRIHLFRGTREDCLRRYERDFD